MKQVKLLFQLVFNTFDQGRCLVLLYGGNQHNEKPIHTYVIYVEYCSNEIGITTINNKRFANLPQLMTLTMFPLTSPYYDNGNINSTS